jgi:uncharacterized SAM-binding protein YcdF (DUF218 family)
MPRSQLLIVLGSTNDRRGNISRVGLGRLTRGLELIEAFPHLKLLLTGGFSKGEKISEYPYAYYARHFMLSNGVAPDRILEPALSRDTIEDAKLALAIIEGKPFDEFIIVTSDFHMDRAKYIFEKVFCGRILSFEAVHYECDTSELQALTEHEASEFALLLKTGKSSIGVSL